MINKFLKQVILILVRLFEKLSMIQIKQNQKMKFLILVFLLKRQITMLKSLKQREKIPSISGLATNAALTTVENKIPNINNLVKKTDYDAKITEIEKKLTDHNCDIYITTAGFNNLTASVFNARLAQANLVTKTDFDSKLLSLNKKFTSNENELKRLKTFDSSYFRGKSHFEEDGTQNYLVFQPINRYFKEIANVKYISSRKSKGLSDESIKPRATSDNSLTPLNDYLGAKIKLKFNGRILT